MSLSRFRFVFFFTRTRLSKKRSAIFRALSSQESIKSYTMQKQSFTKTWSCYIQKKNLFFLITNTTCDLMMGFLGVFLPNKRGINKRISVYPWMCFRTSFPFFRVVYARRTVIISASVLFSHFRHESRTVIFNSPGGARARVMTQRDRTFMIRKTDGRGRLTRAAPIRIAI